MVGDIRCTVGILGKCRDQMEEIRLLGRQISGIRTSTAAISEEHLSHGPEPGTMQSGQMSPGHGHLIFSLNVFLVARGPKLNMILE